MTHPLEQLSALLDDELAPDARAEVELHLAQCAACSAHLAELAALDGLARRSAVTAPEGYFEALPARIRARVRARPRMATPAPWLWAVAAGILLAVLVPATLTRRPAEAPPAAPESRALPQAAPPATVPATALPRPAPQTGGRIQAPAAPREEERLFDGQDEAHSTAPKKASEFAQAPERGRRPVEEAGKTEERVGGLAAAPEPPPPAAPTPPPPRAMAEEVTVGTLEVKRADAASPPVSAPAAFASPEEAPAMAKARRAGETAASAPSASPVSGRDKTDVESRDADRLADVAGARAREPVDELGAEARAEYDALRARTPKTARDARALRDAWRTFARVQAASPEADEARVRMIEAGVLAWRLGRDLPDLYVVHADAQAYLSAAEAPQAERVRKSIRGLPSP